MSKSLTRQRINQTVNFLNHLLNRKANEINATAYMLIIDFMVWIQLKWEL